MSNTREDKVNTLGIATIGVSIVLLLWASIMGLQAYYANTYGAEQARRNALDSNAELKTVQAKHLAQLRGYAWVAQKKGLLRIPIDRAMKLVVADLRDHADSVVPGIGPQNKPTIPAVFGHPPNKAAMPKAGAAPAAGAKAGAAPAAGAKAGAAAAGAKAGAAKGPAKAQTKVKHPAAGPGKAGGPGKGAAKKQAAHHRQPAAAHAGAAPHPKTPGKAGAKRHPRRKATPAGASPRGGGTKN